MEQSNRQISYLPFHAINEFMRPEYRQAVIQSTLQALPSLPANHQSTINGFLKKSVKIPGFRNSLLAPTPLKVKPSISTFEKNPGFVAAVLSAWSSTLPDLRQKVFELLTERGWDVMPPEADRTQLPGFLPSWPANEDFSTLDQAYQAKFPGEPSSADDVNLMVVWLSGRLPWEKSEENNGG
jgi:hypothetical protein